MLPLCIVLVAVLASGCVLSRKGWLARQARRLHSEHQASLARQDFPAAVSALNRLESLAPGNPFVQYDLACALARAGEDEQAITALREGAMCGFGLWLSSQTVSCQVVHTGRWWDRPIGCCVTHVY